MRSCLSFIIYHFEILKAGHNLAPFCMLGIRIWMRFFVVVVLSWEGKKPFYQHISFKFMYAITLLNLLFWHFQARKIGFFFFTLKCKYSNLIWIHKNYTIFDKVCRNRCACVRACVHKFSSWDDNFKIFSSSCFFLHTQTKLRICRVVWFIERALIDIIIFDGIQLHSIDFIVSMTKQLKNQCTFSDKQSE